MTTIMMTATPPTGFIRVTTDKSTYVIGEAVVITVYYTRPTDLCINHIVRCEIIAFFEGRSELCGSRQWDDRQTSFPQTWSFTLFQPYAYTIVASIWHNGQTKGDEHSVRITMARPSVTATATVALTSILTVTAITTTTTTATAATGVEVYLVSVVAAVLLIVGTLSVLVLRKKR